MEIATVKTGQEMWAVVISDSKDFLEEKILECIVLSRKLWPDGQIRITGLDERKIRQLKRKGGIR
ncbi:MAG: hypothetical protein NC906_09390 [Candidatus Omnitrophica bacterium]|nr:hypothetical protein [Candidatus Omnitrophota bacterium]